MWGLLFNGCEGAGMGRKGTVGFTRWKVPEICHHTVNTVPLLLLHQTLKIARRVDFMHLPQFEKEQEIKKETSVPTQGERERESCSFTQSHLEEGSVKQGKRQGCGEAERERQRRWAAEDT